MSDSITMSMEFQFPLAQAHHTLEESAREFPARRAIRLIRAHRGEFMLWAHATSARSGNLALLPISRKQAITLAKHSVEFKRCMALSMFGTRLVIGY